MLSTRLRSALEKTLAAADDDGTVWLWNLANPARPARLGEPLTGPTNAVYSVAFSPDGRTLAAGNDDHTIELWNLPPNVLTSPSGSIDSVAFSPHRILAVGSTYSQVWLWNLADPASPAQHLTGPAAGYGHGANSIAFSP